MGVLIAGVNVMGVWWTGMEGMDRSRLVVKAAQVRSPYGSPAGNFFAYPTGRSPAKPVNRLFPRAPNPHGKGCGCPAKASRPESLRME